MTQQMTQTISGPQAVERSPQAPAVPADSVYELSAVTKVYGSGNAQVRAVDGITLTVGAGEFVAIVGASGSGKTTLLQLLGALDKPTSGRVLLRGQDLTKLSERQLTILRREEIGFVFQQFNLIPTLTATGNIEAALASLGHGSRERRERASEVLEIVGLSGRGHHLPSQLSGGEQQRVAIARALANDPSVLLADEPTGNLDTTTGAEIAAQRVIRLRDGRIVDADGEPPTPPAPA